MKPRAWLDVGCDGTDGLGDLGVDEVMCSQERIPAWELPWIQGRSFCSPRGKICFQAVRGLEGLRAWAGISINYSAQV